MLFNSLDEKYKFPFGAVRCGENVTLRLDAGAFTHCCVLIKLGNNGEYFRYSMEMTDGMFCISTSLNEAGVYFYHFLLRDDHHEQSLYRSDNGCDTPFGCADWQLTIYSSDFSCDGINPGGLIYQIFPDRFFRAPDYIPRTNYSDRVYSEWGQTPEYRSGTVGRVINNDYFCGNLRGIEQKLPYISSLGVTAIYLNPIFEAHSNHRYNTADYMNIDPLLGDDADFVSLCKAAKKIGIDIILDGVFSHTGADSIYFNRAGRYDTVGAYQSPDSPYYPWYRFSRWPDRYDSWWGHDTLPEVDEDNRAYTEFITGTDGVIDHWMKLGASGFRLDVADELPDDFIVCIRNAVKRHGGVLYGEVWEDASNKQSYGVLRRYLLGDELDSVMNYPFAELIKRFVSGEGGSDLINGVMRILENYPKCSSDILMNLLSTHDTERILTALGGENSRNRGRDWQSKAQMNPEQLAHGIGMLKNAAVLQYTLPGIPSLYYGDEIGTEGYRDPFNRASFDWERENDGNALLEFYRRLGRIRRMCPALCGGRFIPAQYTDGYVSYVRACDDGEIYIMVNPSADNAEIWLLPGWRNDVLIAGNEPVDGILTVPAGQFAIMGRGNWATEFFDEEAEI